MKELVKVLKAASDESRIRILNMLRMRPLCVCEIAEVMGLAQSTVSRHLKQLEECGLLQRAKDGLWVEYRLATPPGDSVQGGVLALLQAELGRKPSLASDESRALAVDRREICGQTD
jgi:ArsR family transcriptional regulator